MTVYNLEYSVVDSIGRAQKYMHKGVYATLEDVSNAKQEVIKQVGDKAVFNVYPIENLFEKVSLS